MKIFGYIKQASFAKAFVFVWLGWFWPTKRGHGPKKFDTMAMRVAVWGLGWCERKAKTVTQRLIARFPEKDKRGCCT